MKFQTDISQKQVVLDKQLPGPNGAGNALSDANYIPLSMSIIRKREILSFQQNVLLIQCGAFQLPCMWPHFTIERNKISRSILGQNPRLQATFG